MNSAQVTKTKEHYTEFKLVSSKKPTSLDIRQAQHSLGFSYVVWGSPRQVKKVQLMPNYFSTTWMSSKVGINKTAP
jgi:hypothetical protein